MKKLLVPAVVFLVIAQMGCAKSVRYSAEEIRDYPPAVQDHIKKGEITPGMTMAQVRYSWGGPDQVRVLAADAQGRERVEWTYKRMQLLKTRLVFTNGSITEIVSSEPGIVKEK